MTWTLESLIESIKSVSTEINGKFIPARPINHRIFWVRVKSAWLVLTGRADAVVWPGNQ